MVGKEEEGRRKKAPKKNPLRRDWDLNPRTLSPEPSELSVRPRRPAHVTVKVMAKCQLTKCHGTGLFFRTPVTQSSQSEIF